MEIWQAIILGIVQGIAEFLPISSSGHLVVLQRVFGVDLPSMTFDIIVHIGSLFAVFAVFWRDILTLLKNPFQKMTAMLIVGSIPAAVAGFLFKSDIERIFNQGFYLAIAFILTGILLLVADSIPKRHTRKTEKDMTILDALIVGCMQAVALPPGISRSGATITGGLFSGLNRETAARFSFLLSIIVIGGAGLLEAWEVYQSPEIIYRGDIIPFIIGFVAAAVSGYFAIRLLLELIKKCKLKYFSYYLFILAAWLLLDRFVLNWFFNY